MSALKYRTKKDYSTAIMDRKKAPHKLQVEDSKQDDNSIVEMTQAKMDELKIFRGDAVILKGTCTDSLMELHHSYPSKSRNLIDFHEMMICILHHLSLSLSGRYSQ